jgi:hypothetical protein
MRNHDLVSDGFLTLIGGKPRAAGFELAGFIDSVRRLPARRRTSALLPKGVDAREPDKVEDGNVREPAALIWLTCCAA